MLASLDSNGDGVLDATDEAFGDIRVWVDDNSDGFSQPGELTSLADNDIVSIDLDAQAADYEINGQQIVTGSLGSGSETISMTVRIGYHRHEFGGYLGNVG